MRRSAIAAMVAVLAGSSVSFAQPVVDGQLDTLYGPAKWLQTVPTTYGDNRADLCTSVGSGVAFAMNNDNGGGVTGGSNLFTNTDPQYAAAIAVTTGFEIRIPLGQLGSPTGAIKVAGFINNNGGNYLSNQVIGGFDPSVGATRGNLGGDMNGGFIGDLHLVDLSNTTSAPGDQFVTIPSNAGTNCTGAAPTLDGSLDAAFYGSPIWVQNVQTGFGDPGYHDTNYNDGSEIDAVYGKICRADVGNGLQDYLFLFVAGNLQGGDNFSGNRLQLFFDTGAAGGLNTLTTVPSVDGLSGSVGLKFDTGFNASYYMDFGLGYNTSLMAFRAQAAYARLGANAGGGVVGAGPSVTPIVGAGSNCPPDQAVSVGSEIDGIYSYVDRTHNKLYMLLTGNLKQGDFFTFYFDVNGNPTGDEGQHTVNGPGSFFQAGQRRNVTIGIADGGAGSLNRTGYQDATNHGVTFDTGFAADYYLNTHIENTNRLAMDSAVLPTGGRRENLVGNPLDYGTFVGNDIPTVVQENGSTFCCDYPGGIQRQDGTLADILSHYPPRESYRVLQGFLDNHMGNYPASDAEWADWLGVTPNQGNPVAPASLLPRTGLVQAAIDNRNVAGISDTSGSGAATAARGFELAIDLSELGYTPRSRIRLAGFLNNGAFTEISDQIIGDAAGTANLGDPRLVDFSTIAGNQYVVLASCVADFNGDGSVAVNDIFAFLNAWFAGDQAADVNGGGLGVSDIFDFLTVWFQGPCLGG